MQSMCSVETSFLKLNTKFTDHVEKNVMEWYNNNT